jgi:hypothetical protein
LGVAPRHREVKPQHRAHSLARPDIQFTADSACPLAHDRDAMMPSPGLGRIGGGGQPAAIVFHPQLDAAVVQ